MKTQQKNTIKEKSFNFAVRICKLSKFLSIKEKDYVISRQLLRSGTSVGTMIHEAEHAESKSDFKHKMAIAQKEINETLYWLKLLKEIKYINKNQFVSINQDAIEIIRLITSIIKSAKKNHINH